MNFNQILLFLFSLLLSPLLGSAQSGSHHEQLKQVEAKSPHFHFSYNLPDSLNKVKTNAKTHSKIDTLFSLVPDSLRNQKPNLPSQKLKNQDIDSAQLANKLKDPLKPEMEEHLPSDYTQQYQKIHEVKIDSSYLNKDSLKNKISEQQIEQKTKELINNNTQAQKKISEEFAGAQDLPSVNQDQMSKKYLERQNALKKLFKQNKAKIKTGQISLEDHKKKYQKSNLLASDGPKLVKKDNTPEKRWEYGLGLNMTIDTVSKISIAPLVAFNITNKWRIGTGFSNHLKISLADSTFDFSLNKIIDFRIFNQYFIYNAIFTHIEYEKAHQVFQRAEALQINTKRLSPKIWMGLGVEFKIYKSLRGQTQLLYNVMHKNRFSSEAITIRFNLIR